MSQEGISIPYYSATGALFRVNPVFGIDVIRPFPQRLANAYIHLPERLTP